MEIKNKAGPGVTVNHYLDIEEINGTRFIKPACGVKLFGWMTEFKDINEYNKKVNCKLCLRSLKKAEKKELLRQAYEKFLTWKF